MGLLMTITWSSTAIAFSATAAFVLTVSGCGDSQVNEGIPLTEKATTTAFAQADSVTDTTDLSNLMAISTHVFTGRVESGAGSKALGPVPESQYAILTATSLKGAVPQSITLNQQGGVLDGVYISVNGDTPLTVGQWYLFATRYLPDENWYTVIPVDGHKPITEQQARDRTSPPLAAATAALRSNPQDRLAPASPPSPPMTFPIPQPGDNNPPPPSPTQPR